MSDKESLLVGFLKVRNEIIREGNIYRCLQNMKDICDDIYAVDDSSYDGTFEYLKSQLPEDHIIRVPPDKHDFSSELYWKQELIELIHKNGPWNFIFWQDADEVLDAKGTAEIRNFCRGNLHTQAQAWAFHYAQLWRGSKWARTDSEFDDGWFVKLWRYHPELAFNIQPGTHNSQFPHQIHAAFTVGKVERSPWEVLHYGNYGTNLRFKCLQYWGGLGGVPRHMNFETASYREVTLDKFPSGAEHYTGEEDKPIPFTEEEKSMILKMKNLTNLEKTFCVTISAYNRADTLPRAIDSVLKQTYKDFLVVVIDDGSTDNTKEVMRTYQDKDPRVFYVQRLEHMGGVAVNEVACDIAVNTCEYWVRLGSDDWMAPNKLEADLYAFEVGHSAVFGPFQAYDQVTKQFQEIGNTPYPLHKQKECFEAEGFIAGWADFAVRTSILKKIKEKHGNYCDPNLINMEDCLQNYRVCKISPWVWRGIYKGELVVNPDEGLMNEITNNRQLLTPTGFWNKDPNGSSANFTVYGQDRALTTKIILSEKNVSYA